MPAKHLIFQRHEQPKTGKQRTGFDGAAEELRVIAELPNGAQEESYSVCRRAILAGVAQSGARLGRARFGPDLPVLR